MNKDNSARASFAGLRPDRNKENNLTFHNIKQPTHSHSQSLLGNENQCHKRNANFGQFNNNQFGKVSSNSSKFSDAIKEMHIKNTKHQNNGSGMASKVQQNYTKVQKTIKTQIEQYNAKYTEITEMLADMHIKDLMKLNEMLEKNQELYYKYLEDIKYKMAPIPNFYQCSWEESKKMFETEKAILKIISQPAKSFDFRSTYESRRNDKTISTGSSRVSPQVVKVQTSQNINKNSQKLTKLADSGNYLFENMISKSGSFAQKKSNNSDHMQDTPESVKSKISATSKIKADKDVSIGMFDRINVCQSVEERVFEDQSPLHCKDKQKQKKQHRYSKWDQDF